MKTVTRVKRANQGSLIRLETRDGILYRGGGETVINHLGFAAWRLEQLAQTLGGSVHDRARAELLSVASELRAEGAQHMRSMDQSPMAAAQRDLEVLRQVAEQRGAS